MKAVKVQYTVQENYVEENKKNIQNVMNALKENPIDGMQYVTFTDSENPNTFIHINMAKDDQTMSKLNDLEAFTKFRLSLNASNPVNAPKQTKLSLVDASFDV